MPSHYALRTAVLAAALILPRSFAQTAVPSNASLPYANGTTLLPQIQLLIQESGMLTEYELVPARDPDGPGAATNAAGINATYFDDLDLLGRVVPANTSNFNSLSPSDLAYISCDPSAYSGGNIGMGEVLSTVAQKVMTNATSGAIILYSLTSSWCNLTSDANIPQLNVFTFTEAQWANDLVQRLGRLGELIAEGKVFVNATSLASSNSTGNSGNDPSTSSVAGTAPTTTVAMIILYSITGLITVCFLFIIITGAIRAHRHPERYRPRQIPGQSGTQARARGLGRAMLDSLPIVKFGEREADKPPSEATGMELESGIEARSEREHSEHQPDELGQSPAPQVNADGGDVIAQEPAGDAGARDGGAVAESPGIQAEAGLACSVCTEDFVKGQNTRVLPCKHKFHPECIDPWLLNVSGTCPLCRTDLRPPESRDLGSTNDIGTAPPSFIAPEPSIAATSMPGPHGVPIYLVAGGRDRRSIGLGNRLHRALNSRHMRDATPGERIEALRDLRNMNRDGNETGRTRAGADEGRRGSGSPHGSALEANPSPAPADDVLGNSNSADAQRTGLGSRLRGLLNRPGRNGSGADLEAGRSESPASHGGERSASALGGQVEPAALTNNAEVRAEIAAEEPAPTAGTVNPTGNLETAEHDTSAVPDDAVVR